MNIIEVINENAQVIGQDTRENIHKHGLLHMEVHVWFYTSKNELIFQLRAKNKETFPNLLDATVGGHVEIGDDYIKTALKETFEETGILVKKDGLKFITNLRKDAKDSVTGMHNNVIRAIFAYEYNDSLNDLKIEDNEGQGFEAWSINKLVNNLITEVERKKFIPSIIDNEYLDIFKKIRRL
ncbi:MAG: NUDIX domain-containing protein [Candidatus Woesebacteria bacterium]|nr:NUDIX domain-containing protein [Candidatus Woesebacteria bacterium]